MKHLLLEVPELSRGGFARALQASLGRHPNVLHVAADPVRDRIAVAYDEDAISEADLQRWIKKCRHHCRGHVVLAHVCGPTGPASPRARRSGADPPGRIE